MLPGKIVATTRTTGRQDFVTDTTPYTGHQAQLKNYNGPQPSASVFASASNDGTRSKSGTRVRTVAETPAVSVQVSQHRC